MRNVSNHQTGILSEDLNQDIERRWREALPYFKERGSVLFLSYCRFWEKHGFVQQSLAKLLMENGVRVTWLDGSGWRPYRPSLYGSSEFLDVKQLFELPGRRMGIAKKWSFKLQNRAVRATLKKMGDPIVWVQAGVNDEIASELPRIDVFSTFDDPYRISPESALCSRARVIVCQNSYALKLYSRIHSLKSRLLLPPVEFTNESFQSEEMLPFPSSFAKRMMGYIGSFFESEFDFTLFEEFVRTLPEWGFVLAGRTDELGKRKLERLKEYPNFIHFSWVPRHRLASLWQRLSVCLLFYRRCRTQDGAFPTKVLESLSFGVPCIGTCIPKTEDLEPFLPRSQFPDQLKVLAQSTQTIDTQSALRHFAYEMNPKLHLSKVSEWLQGHS